MNTPGGQMGWERKHLLGIEPLEKKEIEHILDRAEAFKEVLSRAIPKVPTLRGKTIVNFFCEASTRTRTSFELAAKRLSADTLNITASSSSFVKGETLTDTIHNLEAMKVDMVILRHSASGAPHFLAERVTSSVVNAGDGMHEHPTQALLDVFTLREKVGRIKGLKVAIIGDITHSRVARSNIWALHKLGAEVTICGPKTLMPRYADDLPVKVTYDVREAVKDKDALNVLRIQRERQEKAFLPSMREYSRKFGITEELLAGHAKPDVIIMHPGPINRDIEISPKVADADYSVILRQVTNGVAIRMAVLYLLLSSKKVEGSFEKKAQKKE